MAAAPPILASILGIGLLTGCASEGSGFDRRMATYVGEPEITLVNSLGVPNRVYEGEGRRYLQYDFTGLAAPVSSGPSFGLGVGGGNFGYGSGIGVGTGIGFGFGGGASEPMPCQVTFEMREGRVLDFERRGGGCR
ncbi:hypothetical protein ACFOD4_01445 [Pseudoroseomonas globiformis]|uniref:Lipoprotein n=1 Tax=Teichococcus globiformis TaxID=2307229 RepID=A0ABV7FX39_9PROT